MKHARILRTAPRGRRVFATGVPHMKSSLCLLALLATPCAFAQGAPNYYELFAQVTNNYYDVATAERVAYRCNAFKQMKQGGEPVFPDYGVLKDDLEVITRALGADMFRVEALNGIRGSGQLRSFEEPLKACDAAAIDFVNSKRQSAHLWAG